MTILVTGGAGYIGSHTCVELLQAGHDVVVLDNFSNSHPESLNRVEKITGKKPLLVQGDIRDQTVLDKIFSDYACTTVIHLAGLKSVRESLEKPLEYYDVNVGGSLQLIKSMSRFCVRNIVFSSSASVYGAVQKFPIQESEPLNADTPYAKTKRLVEDVLRDIHAMDLEWRVGVLRYFNPIGAHKSGLMGEDPCGIPNNLLPFMAQVAVGRRDCLQIFGGDYPTPDGTCVRDYLHVVDLAKAHVAALDHLTTRREGFTVNLGAGRGYSVLEILKTFEAVCGQKIPFEIVPRRPGDVATSYTDIKAAHDVMGWKPTSTLEEMCQDVWRWQSMNPNGYLSSAQSVE